MLGLSNLCVDLVVDVEQLPDAVPALRQQLLQQLTAHPPGQEHWELGGNANFMIAGGCRAGGRCCAAAAAHVLCGGGLTPV